MNVYGFGFHETSVPMTVRDFYEFAFFQVRKIDSFNAPRHGGLSFDQSTDTDRDASWQQRSYLNPAVGSFIDLYAF